MAHRFLFLSALFISNLLFAKVTFIGGGQPIPIKAYSDQDFSLDVRTLFSNPGSGQYVVTLSQNPAWLKYDSAALKLYGHPVLSDAGKFSARLSVQDGDSGSVAQLDFSVLVSPQWTQSPIDLGKQPEGTPWTFNLATVAKHPLNGNLTFSVENPSQLPEWMSISSDGKGILSGTPERKHVGPYSGINFIVSTDEGVTAKVAASGQVLKVVKPPKWLLNPVALPDAHEDFSYSVALNTPTNIDNFENANLSFSFLGGTTPIPAWLSLSSDGVLTGTPGKFDVTTGNGLSLPIRFIGTVDGTPYTSDTVITLKVIHTNHAPKWTSNIIQLPDAPTKVLYLQDLISFVSDVDGDALTFRIIPGSGPAWASVSTAGKFSGTPNNNFLGKNEWSVEISDGQLTALATLRVNVTNGTPFWLATPTVLPNASEDSVYSQELTNFAKDPDSDALTFSILNGPAFLSLHGSTLTGTPKAFDLGLQTLTVQVTDGFNPPVQTTIQLTVDHVNHAPKWSQNPIVLPGIPERVLFETGLSTFASDVDAGDTLTFSKLSGGPAWVTIDPNGKLSGTPQRGDVGLNTIRVRVTDQANASADVVVNITVIKVPVPPTWLNNPTVLPNAKEDSSYTQNLTTYISNPDAVPVTFNIVSGAPAFISLTGSTLSGVPKAVDLGPQTIVMTLSDGTTTPKQADVKFTVEHVNHNPKWAQDPIVLPNIPERVLFETLLSTFASDVDAGDTLTFSKLPGGPAWITVDAAGKFSGTPQRANVGLNTIRVRVTDQANGSADVTVRITVDKVPVTPTWLSDLTNLPNAIEDLLYSQNLNTYISNPDSVPVTFAIVSGAPDFISLNGSTLSGTPKASNLGPQSFPMTLSDGTHTSQSTIKFVVDHVNHAPVWSQDPIVLPNGPEKVLYQANLATFASDPDVGDVLTFTKLSGGAAWISISPDGKLSGTPARANVGSNTFTVRVADQVGAFKDVTVKVTIDRVNIPPTFASPIDLGTAVEDANYAFDLKPFAKDEDTDDTLIFKLVDGTGPAWLKVDPSGRISGMPAHADVGPFSATFEVTDGKATAQATGTGKVILKNYPPVVVPDSLVFTVKERDTLTVNLNDPQYISDANGDTLTFQVTQVTDWLTLSPTGTLVAKPLFKHIGDQTIPIRISDGKLSTNATILIKVVRDPRAPQWLEDPIRFQAVATKPFIATLKDKAKDLDGIKITFSKLPGGPDWLTVAEDGSLSGTPQETNLGDNTFEVSVKNDLLAANAHLIITVVTRPNTPPQLLVDPITLADANEDVPYAFNLAPFVKDAENDPLIFSKFSGPDWLITAPDGKLSGTPHKPDVGTYDVTFQVTDGRATVDIKTKIKVIPKTYPPTINQENLSFTMKEREVLTVNLVDPKYVQDPQNLPLTFTLVDTDNWVVLTPAGVLTLSPQFKDIGDHVYKFTVSNGKLTSNGTINVKVLRDPRAPKWLEDPVRYTAKVGIGFNADLTLKVKDLDGLPLTFSKSSGDGWLTVSPDGKISGTPQMANLGDNTFVVVAANDQKGADVQVIITVVPNKHDPKWTQDPINLGNLPIDKLFEFDLTKYVVDEDGDTLIFRRAAGPTFLNVRQDGYLSGTPKLTDLGAFTAKFEVSKAIDGVKWIPVNAFGKVVKNDPPTINQTNLVFTVKANDTLTVNLNDPKYVFDPAGSALIFELQASLPWFSLTPAGVLVAKPLTEQIGTHYLPLKVTNAGGLFSVGTITIKVIKGAEEPKWLQDPIRMVAIVNKPFTNTLVPYLQAQEGVTVTFGKTNGPTWMAVASSGDLSGKPLTENLGENYFVVTATNEVGTKSAILIVTVKNDQPNDQNDSVQIDEAVAGAQAEQTWVVDNTANGKNYSKLISSLRSTVGTFENYLSTAQVNHTGVYLSSDPTSPYNARPLRDASGDSLMLWSDSDWVTNFNYRVRNSLSVYCRNTPIWTLHKFYQQASSLTNVYHKGFFTEKVPMDVLIITNHADYYRNYSANTQYRNWSSLDYADEYMQFSQKEKQPYRISAIAPDCTQLQDPLNSAKEQTASNNPYRNLVEKTKGTYYIWDCHTDMAKVLTDFAEKVKFRAYVTAKREILLSKVPADATKIQVTIGGKLIPTTAWTYDKDKNKVIIDWTQIDLSTLKPGDKLEIKYSYL